MSERRRPNRLRMSSSSKKMKSERSAKESLSLSPQLTSKESKRSKSKMKLSSVRTESRMTTNSINSRRRSLLIFCPMLSLGSLQKLTINSSLSQPACSSRFPNSKMSGCNSSSSLCGLAANKAPRQSKEDNPLVKRSSLHSSNSRQALVPLSPGRPLLPHSLSSQSHPELLLQPQLLHSASLRAKQTNLYHSRMQQTRRPQDPRRHQPYSSSRLPRSSLRYSS